jgi:saccharopine dehydrogenase-like NADP-dependent oxidoreductase
MHVRGLVYAVVGAGAMGRIAVRDLVETAPDGTTVLVCDRDARVARAVARAQRSGRVRVRAAQVDARDPRSTARLLRGAAAFAVLSAVQHHFNLTVMDAALAAGAHYCDLGGLFHVTRQQLKLDAAWKKADRLALLGIGAAPGIVNVLARSAADTMDGVREIHVYVAGVDRTPNRPSSALATSYSIQTVLEEASLDAAVFTGGRHTFVPAMSGAVDVGFPAPVGRQRPACTLHSEVATLPLTYRRKGIRECTFRIAFGDELVEKLAFLRAIGMLSGEPLQVGRSSVVPRDVLVKALARHAPAQSWTGIPDEYEILRVVVRGERDGAAVEETVDCHVPGMPGWGLGIDVDTGCPPSIAMQMIARGEITARGCVPPERAVPAEPFFRELELRRMTVRRQASSTARS